MLIDNKAVDCLNGVISFLRNDCGSIFRTREEVCVIIINDDTEMAQKDMNTRLNNFVLEHKKAIKEMEYIEKLKEKNHFVYSLHGTKLLDR